MAKLKKRRFSYSSPYAGAAPKAQLNHQEGIGLGIGMVVCFFAVLVALFCNENFGFSISLGIQCGFSAAVLYWLWPIIGFFIKTVRHRRLPDANFLNGFSPSQKILSCIVLAFCLVEALNYGLPYLLHSWPIWKVESSSARHYHHLHKIKHPTLHYFDILHFAIAWFFVFLSLGLFFRIWLSSRISQVNFNNSSTKLARTPPKKRLEPVFNLSIGETSGWLSKLHHSVGMAANQAVRLSLADAAQNILILGAIGSGKTTRAIHPLLLQCLEQDCGGLIFDIKGDFKNAVYTLAEQAKKSVITIGAHHQPLDLLWGLTPEVAASFLKSVFILNSRNNLDSFWLDTATELCRNSLGVLSFFPKLYSLQGLYQFLFEPAFREEINTKATALLSTFDEKQKRLLKSYQTYHKAIYSQFEDKVKSNVNATVAQVLSPFNHPDLMDAFCAADERSINLQSVIDGNVFLVDMPLATWGLGGKVVYTFIKLRFFNVMQQRLQQATWNQERAVFFLCDEFQEIVSANRDGLSDLNFWDKSRSSKTIGIVSAQSISSFYAAIGDRDIANALLQNFRQKICFKTDDQTTLDSLNRLLGKIEMERKSFSNQQGSSSNPKQFLGSTHKSSSKSLSYVDKAVLDAQLFRQLGQNQAIALLSINGVYRDDVLNMLPIFI